MNELEFERAKKLDQIFQSSIKVCDPIEFFKRQHLLLHEMADFLLQDYYRELERRKTEEETN
jgi:hypothetical protein